MLINVLTVISVYILYTNYTLRGFTDPVGHVGVYTCFQIVRH